MNKGLLFVYLTDFTNQLLTDESIGFYVLKINIYIYIFKHVYVHMLTIHL